MPPVTIRADRVRAHLFLCLLAAYLRWHLERAWAPLLFRDEAPRARTDPVGPPERSAGARAKERDHLIPDGLAVHSFGTLLGHLATLTENRIVPAGLDDRAAFRQLSVPTALQDRAFESSASPPPPCSRHGAPSSGPIEFRSPRFELGVRSSRLGRSSVRRSSCTGRVGYLCPPAPPLSGFSLLRARGRDYTRHFPRCMGVEAVRSDRLEVPVERR